MQNSRDADISTLPQVSQAQAVHALKELGIKHPGYRKDFELSWYFDTMSDLHIDINIMVNAWGTSFLFHSAFPLRNLQVLRKQLCNNDQLRKRL